MQWGKIVRFLELNERKKGLTTSKYLIGIHFPKISTKFKPKRSWAYQDHKLFVHIDFLIVKIESPQCSTLDHMFEASGLPNESIAMEYAPRKCIENPLAFPSIQTAGRMWALLKFLCGQDWSANSVKIYAKHQWRISVVTT